MNTSIVVSKSVFDIRPFSKKTSKCKLTKKVVTLDLDQWCKLMCANNFNTIIENLHTRSKRVNIADNFFYSVNVNQSTIVLYSNDNYITLSHIDFHRLKKLQHCIDLYIVENRKKLESYKKRLIQLMR
ncbi:Uncharacterized protein FWK35_00021035 [Aphis craccivora]|uniref:Uncharacterized protein n=1 Tax=Aphis craccivora TaxID=307492 RepID=A0A6G0XCN2_APHCR|nr:Uncharacterized protein FWK35_00021035 [Aphis craccivora]